MGRWPISVVLSGLLVNFGEGGSLQNQVATKGHQGHGNSLETGELWIRGFGSYEFRVALATSEHVSERCFGNGVVPVVFKILFILSGRGLQKTSFLGLPYQGLGRKDTPPQTVIYVGH